MNEDILTQRNGGLPSIYDFYGGASCPPPQIHITPAITNGMVIIFPTKESESIPEEQRHGKTFFDEWRELFPPHLFFLLYVVLVGLGTILSIFTQELREIAAVLAEISFIAWVSIILVAFLLKSKSA